MPMTATMAPYTLFILDDDTPLNPREDHDCLGKMVCWHSRYSLGEKHDYDEPSDFLRNLLFSEYSSGHDRNNPVFAFLKSGKAKDARLEYNRSTREWELRENQHWSSDSDWYVSSSYAASLKDEVPDWFLDDCLSALTTGELFSLVEQMDGMAKVMEKRFANWQGQSFDEATLEPSDLAEAMMEYLDCECTYFPSMTDDDPIMSAYNYAKRESVKEGFVPVLIKADDEILWECLIMNSDPDSDGEDDFAFDPDKVAEYRKKMLSAPVENSKAVLEEMIGQRKEEAEDDDMDWDEEILGEMEGGYDNRRFSSYWNSDNNMTYPLILAKIPVKNPWEIFAYLPFGGWNECPNTPELMAVAKYWFEQHGAVPAAMSHDELEFLLPAPVPEEKAMDAAVELYGFCPDVIDQGPEDATVGALADVLRQSTVWYFWWD